MCNGRKRPRKEWSPPTYSWWIGIYCSCDGDCDSAATTVREGSASCGGLEQLFFDQGVDFFMNGHEHDYERMWPTYKDKTDSSNVDPKATIYIGECPSFLQVRNLALLSLTLS